MSVEALKIVHVAALVMWLGPTTAGYLFVTRACRDRDRGQPLPRGAELWVWGRFERLLRIEHAAFVLLVASGLALLDAYGLTPLQVARDGPRWLQIKLGIALLVLVPLEARDIYLSHIELPRLLSRLHSSEEDLRAALARHRAFLTRGVYVFAVLLPALFWAVAYRPV